MFTHAAAKGEGRKGRGSRFVSRLFAFFSLFCFFYTRWLSARAETRVPARGAPFFCRVGLTLFAFFSYNLFDPRRGPGPRDASPNARVWASFRASRRRDRSTFEELAVAEDRRRRRKRRRQPGLPKQMANPEIAFGVNAPQTPPRRLPRRGELPGVRQWLRVRRGGQRSLGDASQCVANRDAELAESRAFEVSRETARTYVFIPAISSAGAASAAFDLDARGILTVGCDRADAPRDRLWLPPSAFVQLSGQLSARGFRTRKPPDWHDFQ